jgi:hypothetical protein
VKSASTNLHVLLLSFCRQEKLLHIIYFINTQNEKTISHPVIVLYMHDNDSAN